MTKYGDRIEVKKAIAEYIKANGVTTTRDIAAGVANTIGFRPSTATVADVLRELSYYPPERVTRWVFRHNGGDHGN